MILMGMVFDIYDNSPLVANADQTDEDGDGVGDVSDDFDHDGVWNPLIHVLIPIR